MPKTQIKCGVLSTYIETEMTVGRIREVYKCDLDIPDHAMAVAAPPDSDEFIAVSENDVAQLGSKVEFVRPAGLKGHVYENGRCRECGKKE